MSPAHRGKRLGAEVGQFADGVLLAGSRPTVSFQVNRHLSRVRPGHTSDSSVYFGAGD
jgi:hypothetical protein